VAVERLGKALHRAPFAHPATVRGRVCGRIGPLVHWYSCVVAVRAGGRARTWPVRSGRARESRGPVRFTRARGASPDSAAAAQGHFCHTLSVRRWPGASPQRGGRLVVRPAAPASRKHPVVIGAGCAARERRWKGPMPSFSALSAWHSRRRGRRTSALRPVEWRDSNDHSAEEYFRKQCSYVVRLRHPAGSNT